MKEKSKPEEEMKEEIKVEETVKIEPEKLDLRMMIAISIMKMRCNAKRSNYNVIYENNLDSLDEMTTASFHFLSIEDLLYIDYLKASINKKMGLLFDAKEMFEKLIVGNAIPKRMLFKVNIKLAKIYTDLFNHFEARAILRKVKAMLNADEGELAHDLKLKAIYYQAKCKYFDKLGIIKKLSRNADKLAECQDKLNLHIT